MDGAPVERVPEVAGLVRVGEAVVGHGEAHIVGNSALAVLDFVVANVDHVGDAGGQWLKLLHEVVPQFVFPVGV